MRSSESFAARVAGMTMRWLSGRSTSHCEGTQVRSTWLCTRLRAPDQARSVQGERPKMSTTRKTKGGASHRTEGKEFSSACTGAGSDTLRLSICMHHEAAARRKRA